MRTAGITKAKYNHHFNAKLPNKQSSKELNGQDGWNKHLEKRENENVGMRPSMHYLSIV